MCDCYGHKCELCGRFIDIHLGDYATERTEIKVFCTTHYKKVRKEDYPYSIFEINHKNVAIVYMTDNAIRRREHNTPNYSNAILVETEDGII